MLCWRKVPAWKAAGVGAGERDERVAGAAGEGALEVACARNASGRTALPGKGVGVGVGAGAGEDCSCSTGEVVVVGAVAKGRVRRGAAAARYSVRDPLAKRLMAGV